MQVFISYERFLIQRLYEPFLHFTYVFICFRALNPCIYLSPGVYMSPAFIQINTVYKIVALMHLISLQKWWAMVFDKLFKLYLIRMLN